MEEKSSREGEIRYIEVLIDSYPDPISHTELAVRARVSKAAITKAKDKLKNVCDLNELVYDKFVLKDDTNNIQKLGKLFFWKDKISKFITSRYTLSILKRLNIHERIAKEWPAYGQIFDKDDTDFMMEILVRNLSAAKEIRQITEKISNQRELLYLHSMKVFEQLEPVMKKVQLHIKDGKTLVQFLELRDKWFALIMYELSKVIGQIEILKNLGDNDKKTFESVYVKTADFYLRKILNEWSQQFRKVAAEHGVDFKEEYYEIGSFYQKPKKKVAHLIA